MKTYVLIGLVVLMPLATVMAQSGQWQSMDVPYYIYNVTGISIGYQGEQTYGYAVGSDLEYNYIYSYQGNSPITGWSNKVPIDGIKYISASRFNGQTAYASVPSESPVGTPGAYHKTPIISWQRTTSQPDNLHFTGIWAHPNNANICFTSGIHIDGVSSIYKTDDPENGWLSVTPPSGNDCNAICIDPNSPSPGELANTMIYACFANGGKIYKSSNGGGSWTGPFSFTGVTSYDGISVAVKEGDSQNVYAVIHNNNNGDYELWHSTDGGSNWGSTYFSTFGTTVLSKVLVLDRGGADAIWVVSKNDIYVHSLIYNQWFDLSSGGNDFLCLEFDTADPAQYFVAYAGEQFYTEMINFAPMQDGSFEIGSRGMAHGTNIADIISLDCIEGYTLKGLSKYGGFVFQDQKMLNQNPSEEWQPVDCLQKYIISEDPVIGTEISNGIIRTDWSSNHWEHRELGIVAGQGNGGPIITYDGHIVDPEDASNISTVGVQKFDGGSCDNGDCAWYDYLGGNNSGENAVFKVSGLYNDILDYDYNLASQPPLIKDIILEEDPWDYNSWGAYYYCGARNGGGNVFFKNGDESFSISSGLDIVNTAYAILLSDDSLATVNGIRPDALYLGTDHGMYKTHFDLIHSPTWYPINNGINSNVSINKLANYNHIIKNQNQFEWPGGVCPPLPDSLIQYALGHDISNNPYIYSSADSGRSWIEIGGYFRNLHYQVNDLATFSDTRPGMGTIPAFLGVGTDNGVYRYPYNVFSGVIVYPGSQTNITWGPGLIIINGDVTVPSGKTLTILPGTDVEFVYNFDRCASGSSHSKSELVINGTLNALGTLNDPIVFESSRPTLQGAGQWYGIRVEGYGHVNLDYCEIKHADYGIRSNGHSYLAVNHTLMDLNTSAGIYMNVYPNSATISNSRIQNSGTYGIYCGDGMFTSTTDTLLYNKYGVYYKGYDSPDIEYCRIIAPSSPITSYYGIYIFGTSPGATPQILGNYIAGFTQGGIYLTTVTSRGLISFTTIDAGSIYGIYCTSSSVSILGDPPNGNGKRNLIHGNTNGIWLTSSSNPIIRRTKFDQNNPRNLYIASGCWPDIHPQTLDQANSFHSLAGFSYCDIYNANASPIDATGNYWGENPPADNQIYNATYVPYYTQDPLPRMAPPSPINGLPNDLELATVYPNPFNPTATISFGLASPQVVSVNIYNIMGQKIRSLSEGYLQAGTISFIWDGKDSEGRPVSSGLYFCSIQTETKQQTVKLTMLK
ncbi:MAG TPA: hypothetical protein DEO84_06785 [candidate division Zixibacteria bacterium]|nr:hypothetical protein [candidate division Zixibacteria bacterium]